MKTIRLFVMASVLALMASPVLAHDHTTDSAQDCWAGAFVNMDADAVAQCYAPDAVLWLPGMPMMKGRDAIREGHVGFFSAFTVKGMKLSAMGKSRNGDETTNWGSFTLTMVSKADGKEVVQTGRYTDVSRKIDGKWLYVMDHASDDPAPAPVSAPPAS